MPNSPRRAKRSRQITNDTPPLPVPANMEPSGPSYGSWGRMLALFRQASLKTSGSMMALIIANAIGVIATIANFKLLIAFFSTETMGHYALLTTYQSMTTLIVLGPIRVGLVRLYAAQLSRLSGIFLRFLSGVYGMAAAASLVGAIAVAAILVKSFPLNLVDVAACVLFSIAVTLNDIMVGISLQNGLQGQAAIRTIIGRCALTMAILACRAAGMLDFSSMFFLAAAIIGVTSLQNFMQDRGRYKKIPDQHPAEWRATIFTFFGVVAFTGILSTLQLSLPRYILSARTDNAELARFYVSTQIANLIMVAWMGTISQIISPKLFAAFHRDSARMPFPLSAPVCAGLFMVIAGAAIAAITFLVAGDALVDIGLKKAYAGISPIVAASFLVYGIYGTAQIVRLFGDQIQRPQIFLAVNIFYPLTVVVILLASRNITIWYVLGAMLIGECIHLASVTFISMRKYRSAMRLQT